VRLATTCIVLAAGGLPVGCRSSSTASVNAQDARVEPSCAAAGKVALPPGSPKLKRIRVDAVVVRSFPMEEIVAPGKVEANPNRISRITVPVAGRVSQVFVRLGASVEQGQPLFAVDSVDSGAAIASYRQAQAQARVAASALNKAQADLSRLTELYDHGAAALKDLVAARNDYTQAQVGVEQAQTAREEAGHHLELLGLDPAAPTLLVTVRAPISGKVLDIAVVPGEFRNDTSAPLMTIADLSTVWISADVPESLIRVVDIAEAIEVSLYAYPGEVFRGRVMRIADVVDPQTRTVKVQAEIANPNGRLRPEMFGQIRHSHGARSMPAVPVGAVAQLAGKSVVWVEESAGGFRPVEVQPGPRQGDWVAIPSGVAPGDRIVTDGVMLITRD